jgi:hypothetical protein
MEISAVREKSDEAARLGGQQFHGAGRLAGKICDWPLHLSTAALPNSHPPPRPKTFIAGFG